MIFITGEKLMISSIKELKSLAVAIVFIISIPFSNTIAQEIELPGFSGKMNTTVTSGVSIRTGKRNCSLQDGYQYNVRTNQLSATGLAVLGLRTDLTTAQALSGGNKNYLFSDTCARQRTDAYGNTSTDPIEYGNVNTDDGNLNYDNGDVVDATTKALVEISGSMDNGLGVNLSFISSYNAVDRFTTPAFKKLTNKAERELESDVSILDAYVTGSIDTGNDVGFIDITAGRFVTSWGEATFIPVGMNGFVTNAIDLSKLRAPGASIRDALIPTEQISMSFNAGDVGFEIYAQLQSSAIQLDPAGSFFGNEVAGTGGNKLLANGAYTSENDDVSYCGFVATVLEGRACNAATKAVVLANPSQYSDSANAELGYRGADAATWATWSGTGAAVDHGGTFQSRLVGTALEGQTLYVVNNTMENFTTDSTDAVAMAGLVNLWNNVLRDDDAKSGAVVEISAADQKIVEARNDGQWGIRANTYLDNVGTGVDLGFYFANYHSKIPYTRIIGMGGLYAGDILGAYATVIGDYLGTSDASPGLDATDAASISLWRSAMGGTYGSGICGGLGSLLGHAAFNAANESTGSYAFESRQVYQNLINRVLVEGEMVHNAATCRPNDIPGAQGGGPASNPYNAATMGLFSTLTPALAGAVTPLNYAQYQLYYEEDIEVIGASFNTNIGGTTVQGEMAFRPEMPLATSVGDQVNQIADASGVTLALTAFGHDTYALAPANIPAGLFIPATVNTLNDATLLSVDFDTLLQNSQRSSLPRILRQLTSQVGLNYNSTSAIRYDVLTADIGTTTSFSASHPVNQILGSDTAVLLTELATVRVQSMNNRVNGFVARNGFNEGSGEHLCLGIFGGLSGTELATLNTTIETNLAAFGVQQIDYDLSSQAPATNVGASIVDAVFGNGSYCEGKMGADATAYSYRVVGSATYNNVANSPWSLSPSFSWSHDPKGNAPSSIGGFTEDRASLSLGLTARKGEGLSASFNWINEMGEITSNGRADMDYLSASVTYAF
jgi:hypothetical protein